MKKRVICGLLVTLCCLSVALPANAASNEDELKERFSLREWIESLYEEDTYNYVAIGNSLTVHELTDFWWNECGMAATTKENDYVHQLSAMLKDKSEKEVEVNAIALKEWEKVPEGREEELHKLDDLLNEDTDLVTVQLSDNAWDDFEADYEKMLEYIKEKSPNAQIITIGAFWDISVKDSFIKEAAECENVDYVSLDGLKNVPDFQSTFGATVYDPQGIPHQINLNDVAIHPNDEGMKKIAERVFEKVE